MPLLVSPSNGSYVNAPMILSFYIGSTAMDGSIELTIRHTGAYQNGSIINSTGDTAVPLVLSFGSSYSSIGLHSVTIPSPHITMAPLGSDMYVT